MLPEKGVHNVIVSNNLHIDILELSLEAREVFRYIMCDQAEKNDVQLLHWSVTPRSYRAVVRCDLRTVVKHKSRVNDLSDFYKAVQQRFGYWTRVESIPHQWKDRVQTGLLDEPKVYAAAAISCDAMPLVQNVAPSADSYFFTSYWHAKTADSPTIDSIRTILKSPKEDWKEVKKSYRKILTRVGNSS